MPERVARGMIAAGALLLAAALAWSFYNRWEDAQAGRSAERLLAGEKAAVGRQTALQESAGPEQAASSGLPAASEQELLYDCMGTLAIPVLELELPVLAGWDPSALKIAPCRHFGSAENDDLVIAAHNYQSHFGRLGQLSEGDTITFTATDGAVYAYAVARIEVIASDAVDAVQNSGCALVLYTCTKGGASRVAVFCERTDSGAE